MTQRYDTYKDSGVQWIGKIPSHWTPCTVRTFAQEYTEKNKPEKTRELLALSYALGVTLYRDKQFNMDRVKEDYEEYKIVHENDLVLSPNDIIKGSVYVSKYYGCISPMYLIFKSRFEDKNYLLYLSYLLRTQQAGRKLFSIAKGLIGSILDNGKYVTRRMSVSRYDLLTFKVVMPPIDEQSRIVSFLDAKCGKIDEWVTKKQKEVEHLQELKQRVIADAVTRGLNPNVKMKQTVIPWLSEVPEHWEIYRYGTLFKLKPVKQHHGEELLSVFLNLGVIRAAESDKRTHAASEDLSKYQLVEETDFVMNNQQAWRGSVGVSKLVGIISPAYHIFKMPNCMFPNYANYLLRSKCMVSQFEMSSRGVGSIQRTLNFNWLNNKIVPVPPLSEQRSIVSYLDAKSSKIDKLSANITKEIECIKEYKQRLISDVVTGQIKVC